MPTFRDIRAKVFKSLKVKPRRAAEPKELKVERALGRIRATPDEAKAVIAFAGLAKARGEQRKRFGATGRVESDPILVDLRERTHKLLGKERADEFFDLCYDPYF